MKKLTHILADVKIRSSFGLMDLSISRIVFDSRLVEEGDVFVALRGTQTDGHQYTSSVIQKGAKVIICESSPEIKENDVTFVEVEDTSIALGKMASAFYNHPSRQLKVIGVTGTNGKSSIVFLLYQLYNALGYQCGLLSTIENRIGETILKSTHTTGDALQINKNLSKMVEAGCGYCFMEISSHAIDQNRIAGLNISGAIFTNLTHDHLDYHLTFDNYIKAKKALFDQLPKTAFALVNTDDKHGMVMLQNTKAKKASYSIKSISDFKGRILENLFEGLQLRINQKDIWTHLVGKFNAYNLMAAFGTAMLEGQDEDEILLQLSLLKPVEGRFQVLPSNSGIIGVVDYAHTPDALKNVLQTIQAVRNGNEHIICIVGAGGNRDTSKRPLLAKIACEYSDRVILTSDNPRNEDPEEILKEMETGVDVLSKRKTVKITDRKEAIKMASMISVKGDIILVAGKGHETYQEVNGVRHHFDDRELLSMCLKEQE